MHDATETERQIQVDRIGAALAAARIGEMLVGSAVDLRRIGSFQDAMAVRSTAAAALGGDQIGYMLSGTSEVTARLLGLEDPIVGPIFNQDRVLSGRSRTVAASMLGVGAQLAFLFGQSYSPGAREEPDLDGVAAAIVACHVSLQVLARRVPHRTPLNVWTATADFGLVDTFVQGPRVESWRDRLRASERIALRVDGHVLAEGGVGDTMGHPLAPVAWLAEHLAEQGGCISAGDIVATGSCTGLVQMSPGRLVTGDFGSLGAVRLRLE